MTTHTAETNPPRVIRSVERRPNSASGNPRWRVHTNDGTWDTYRDSQINYGINEYVGKPVELTFRDGQISNIALAGKGGV